jgi:NAD(P)-dependent dehydrogenase (short-subunit alcohol dehydrogenase family)
MRKVVVITGASSGFGAMSARHLADAGHTVYAIYGSTERRLKASQRRQLLALLSRLR